MMRTLPTLPTLPPLPKGRAETPQDLAHHGETLRSHGVLHAAINCFTQAIQLAGGEESSTYAWAFAHRGAARLALGDLKHAIEDLKIAIERYAIGKPPGQASYGWAEAHLGEAYRMRAVGGASALGQFALPELPPAPAGAPAGVRSLLSTLAARLRRGVWSEDVHLSIQHLSRAIDVMPRSAWAYAHRGASYTLAYWIELAAPPGVDWAQLGHADFTMAGDLNSSYAWGLAFHAFLKTLEGINAKTRGPGGPVPLPPLPPPPGLAAANHMHEAREQLGDALLADVNHRLAVRRALAELYSFDADYPCSLTAGYQALQMHPEDHYARYFIAVALNRIQDVSADAAVQSAQGVLQCLMNRVVLLQGGLYALKGCKKEALEKLAELRRIGPPDLDTLAILRTDTAWDGLRQDPDFLAIFNELYPS